MNDILIYRKNSLGIAPARAAAEHLAAELRDEFGLQSRWQGDSLLFEHAGVSGELAISSEEVILSVRLGFLLAALKPQIEREVRRHFDANFPA